jgi:hypothetical protein
MAQRHIPALQKEQNMTKIFVRHRRRAGKGEKRPRFAIVAIEGAELTVYRSRVRRRELETIASEIGAEIVYLPMGEHAGESDHADAEED